MSITWKRDTPARITSIGPGTRIGETRSIFIYWECPKCGVGDSYLTEPYQLHHPVQSGLQPWHFCVVETRILAGNDNGED